MSTDRANDRALNVDRGPGNGIAQISGNYIWSPGTDFQGNSASGWTGNAGYLYVVPFICNRRFVADQLTINVTSTQLGKVAKVGVWSMLSTGRPGAVLLAVDKNLGTAGLGSANCRFEFREGCYWIGFAWDASTAALTGINNADCRTLGQSSAGSNPMTFWRYKISWTAGTELPDYPSGEDRRTSDPPMIILRVA